MRVVHLLRTSVLMAGIALSVAAQNPQAGEAQGEARGLPPRASAADFQAQTQAGAVIIAAEFTGHSVPTIQGPLTSEDYVVVDLGVYGPPETRIRLSVGDFSLRVNGRKEVLAAQAFGWVLPSLRDPEWIPPEEAEAKASKSKLSGGGSGDGGKDPNAPPPSPPKIPVPLQRAMAQRVQRAALPEGDRALPIAGLLFFQYRGKADGIRAVELIYSGPAGKATLALPR
jgi:hypothetical protein